LIDETENPEWMNFYHSALLELDSRKLGERIKIAETAIQQRLASGTGGEREYRAIRDARQNLRVLQQELTSPAPIAPDPIVPASGHVHPEMTGEYVVFVDANRRYLDVTEGVCSLLGYSRAELVGKTIDDITPPEIKGNVSATFQQFVNAGGLSGQFLLMARDGRRIPIRYDARVFPDGCLVACWEPLQLVA
jgi:PAS domain S-box-containing protein